MLEYTEEMDRPVSSITESTATTTKKKKNKNKRRFSDEQVKSLESVFESETRLEPRKKLQVAKELGLQPRQVAIWFQNKRARWKTKQLEQDYSILQANYDNLAAKYECLKKEKQALAIQLQKLNDLNKKPKEEGQCCGQVTVTNCNNDGDKVETTAKCDSEGQLSFSMGRSEQAVGVLSDDDSAMKTDYFGVEEEPNLLRVVDPATSPEDWGSFESDGLFDQSNCGYPWWDFWS